MRLYISILAEKRNQKSSVSGFTLIEVLVATVLAGLVLTSTSGLNLTFLRTNASLESTQRKRQDWAKTAHFIESEVALSERVITNPALISSNSCNKTIKDSDFRFAIDFGPTLPLAIYHIEENPKGIDFNGDFSLRRCGPSDDKFGKYEQGIGTPVEDQLVVDGMTASCQIDPKSILPTVSDGYSKSLTFELCLRGLSRANYSQILYTFSRVNPVDSFPREGSLCTYDTIEGFRRDRDGTSSAEDIEATAGVESSLICGNGGGDTITGSTGNDILEAGDDTAGKGIAQGALLDGQLGNDRLIGNTGNDTLIGGVGDDVLIGGDGADIMKGDSGNNDYLPGSGDSTIEGGAGLDTLYMYENKSLVGISDVCTTKTCTLKFTRNGVDSSIISSGVELVIFEDGRFYVKNP